MITFSKYEATGNDFVIIENLQDYKNEELSDLSRKICDRHYGVGADGVLFLYNTQYKNYLRIFNADGSEASICGNGLRCAALHIILEGCNEKKFSINTLSGEKRISIDQNIIGVDMGIPKVIKTVKDVFHSLHYSVIDVGNLHAVVEVNDVRDINIEEFANKNFRHNQYNITFVSLGQKKDVLNVRVYERGVGETLSCGSGSCAAFFYMRKQNKIGRSAVVNLEGGTLNISEGNNQQIMLKGPATLVFKGEYNNEE